MFNLQGLQGHRKRTGKRVYNTTNGGRSRGREEGGREGGSDGSRRGTS